MLKPRLPPRAPRWNCQCRPLLSTRGFARARTEKSSPPIEASAQTTTIRPPELGERAMRTYKPRTPGLRHLRRPINDHLWKGRPHLPLTIPRKGQAIGGRNNTGRIMVRHRGGGHKRRLRKVDFDRMEPGKHNVERIEHDPGRNAHIALITNVETGEKSYIVAAEGMRAGDEVQSFRTGLPPEIIKSMGHKMDLGMVATKTVWRGNCLPLALIPIGTVIFNIGLRRGKGAQMCRSAGTYGQITGYDSEDQRTAKYVHVRLQSGEVRSLPRQACATIGVASNVNFNKRMLGKAGRKRWLGIRPTVRGLAMNAADHPHGGGRGKSKGNVHPVSPWGVPAKSGSRTRPRSKVNRNVVVPRPRNQGRRRRDQSGSRK